MLKVWEVVGTKFFSDAKELKFTRFVFKKEAVKSEK
jgi:hypothetical protein